MQFIQQSKSLIVAGVSDVLELRALSQRLRLFLRSDYYAKNSRDSELSRL